MIEVRSARRDDLPFIKELTLKTLDQGIPAGRDIANEKVREVATQHLEDLEVMLRRRRAFGVLIAEEEQERLGFLILEYGLVEETTGEKQTLIYNMAVADTALGRRVDRLLVSEAARVSHRRGCRYMTARITASNERALFAAIKQGFEIERYQVTMGCGPDGPQPLPGRTKEERAHDMARLLRQRQRRKEGKTP